MVFMSSELSKGELSLWELERCRDEEWPERLPVLYAAL